MERAYSTDGRDYKYINISVTKTNKRIDPIHTHIHVRWVTFHHGIVRPQVADGEKATRYGG
jgi:hypothetical protein